MKNSKKIPVLAIVGPTASGKSKLAVKLAQKYNGEIVSADSMQIYKDMNIATAKPTIAEMDGVPHHLVGCLNIGENYSVANYVSDAKKIIDEIYAAGKLPILAGGTGLYLQSLLEGVVFDRENTNEAVRIALEEELQEKGADALYQELKEVDPEIAEKLHPNNMGRVMRALEVYRVTGRKMSDIQKEAREVESPYQSCIIGLTFADREKLYQHINERVDKMLRHGLLEEANGIFERNLSKTAKQAIGYKELNPFFRGEATLPECIERLKQETRNYAKRQITWFKRMENIHFIEVDTIEHYEDLISQCESLIKKELCL